MLTLSWFRNSTLPHEPCINVLIQDSSMYILVYTSSGQILMTKTAVLKIQQWGNSLAVRIPSAVARSAQFEVGMEVEVMGDETGVMVRPLGPRKLTLEERLARFDPALHGGEAMVVERVGTEVL
jgi:antitoxin MazE